MAWSSCFPMPDFALSESGRGGCTVSMMFSRRRNYALASLMASWARFSAVFASALASASGLSRRIALTRFTGLPFSGALQAETLPLGCTAVTPHFKQPNLIFRLWLTWRAATQSLRLLNARQASLRLVRGGRMACNCNASFLFWSWFAASCSVAVGPFLIQWIGLKDCAAALAAPKKKLVATTPTNITLAFIFTLR